MNWKVKKLKRDQVPDWAKSIILHSYGIDGYPPALPELSAVGA